MSEETPKKNLAVRIWEAMDTAIDPENIEESQQLIYELMAKVDAYIEFDMELKAQEKAVEAHIASMKESIDKIHGGHLRSIKSKRAQLERFARYAMQSRGLKRLNGQFGKFHLSESVQCETANIDWKPYYLKLKGFVRLKSKYEPDKVAIKDALTKNPDDSRFKDIAKLVKKPKVQFEYKEIK